MLSAEDILHSAGKFRIELGLERISKVLSLLGNPQNGLKIIHVAGTNGKGSTCAILEEILTYAGFKTGKFTSPHLFSYVERITVNKRPISENDFNKLVKRVYELDKKENIALTEFEILTAAGFLYFKEQNCDVVILEVGLGGRLDSTNVIASPLVSVITSISLEHTERLGDTVEKIAREKAGIMKPGAKTVFLKSNQGYETLKACAKAAGAEAEEADAVEIKDGSVVFDGVEVPFNLKGKHQGENLALALKTVEILNKSGALGRKIEDETVKDAIRSVKWAFRMEEREIGKAKILIDACHNPDGGRVLGDYLEENYSKKTVKFIFGCLKNKDYISVLRNLLYDEKGCNRGFNFEFCFYEFNYPGALRYEEFCEGFEAKIGGEVRRVRNPLEEIGGEGVDLTVFCGSIYMLGEVFKEF